MNCMVIMMSVCRYADYGISHQLICCCFVIANNRVNCNSSLSKIGSLDLVLMEKGAIFGKIYNVEEPPLLKIILYTNKLMVLPKCIKEMSWERNLFCGVNKILNQL